MISPCSITGRAQDLNSIGGSGDHDGVETIGLIISAVALQLYPKMTVLLTCYPVLGSTGVRSLTHAADKSLQFDWVQFE